MAKLRPFLAGIVSQVNIDWRRKRKQKKEKELKKTTGIDTEAWMNTMPDHVKTSTGRIIESLGSEAALEKYTPGIKALSGHLKTGQRWSPQNRPTGMARDGVVLPLSMGSGQARFGPPAPRSAFEDVTMVEQSVQHRSHGGAVAE